MTYKQSYSLLRMGVIGGAIIVFIGLSLGANGLIIGNALSVVGLIAMLSGLGQALLFYKCPKCGRHFNIRGKRPDYCPECGNRLD